jgi:rSAM/selenodomain-associated transferase 1
VNGDLHIAVFAKAPMAGRVKTRLIPLLGEAGAAQAQRAMTQHALTIAGMAAPSQISLWTDGDHDHPFLLECDRRFNATRHRQCEGDLGRRMANCFEVLLPEHRHVVLIGTDCPVLSVLDLQQADAALQRGARMTFTPAEDGGYVLVGMRRTEGEATWQATQAAFGAITWSTDAVMAQTRAALATLGWSAQRDWVELAAKWDVDTPADYLRAVREGLQVV